LEAEAAVALATRVDNSPSHQQPCLVLGSRP